MEPGDLPFPRHQGDRAGDIVRVDVTLHRANGARTGWAQAARKIAEAGDDTLVMGDFGNADDAELIW